jgi:Sensors of blue-light using FAD
MLVQLTYASRASVEVTPQVVRDIAEKSQKNNSAVGITGALCFSNGIFLQKLEGDRQLVNRVYRKIQNDARHAEAVIVDYSEMDCRDFTGWGMGFLVATNENQELFLKYSTTHEFNPYLMSAKALRLFFNEIKQNVRWLK